MDYVVNNNVDIMNCTLFWLGDKERRWKLFFCYSMICIFFYIEWPLYPLSFYLYPIFSFMNVTHAKHYQEGNCSNILILNKDMFSFLTQNIYSSVIIKSENIKQKENMVLWVAEV